MSDPVFVKPNAIGRPSMIYDARRIRKMLRDIQRGIPRKPAAERAGINPATFERWMTYGGAAERRSEEGFVLESWEERFRAFRLLVQRAEAEWEARTLAATQALAIETKRPSIMLELLRRHPASRSRWNVPQTLELVGDQDPTGAASMTDAELSERLARLEAIARERETEGVET